MAQTMERLDEETAEEDEPSGRARRLRLLVIAGLVVGLVVAGAWLWPSGESGDGDATPNEGAVVRVQDMTVNLADDSLRYARVSLALVLTEGAEAGRVEQRFPILQDAALTEISGMTADEIRSTEGIAHLRERLDNHAADVYPDGQVLRVLVTELVVQ